MSEIIDSSEVAYLERGDDAEAENALVATTEATGEKIEFHVAMKAWTLRDMESLIIEAAARQIVGRSGDTRLAQQIEKRVMELTAEKVDRRLADVTTEIIDQPVTPSYGEKKPVTMRELIGLYGREYLTQTVDRDGTPSTNHYHSRPRMQQLVERYCDAKFKAEIEAATSAAIREIGAEVRQRYDAILTAEKIRFRDALDKLNA